MMLDNKILQSRIIDNIHSLASAQRLSWSSTATDSYRTKAGELQVDVDKSAVGEQVVYVLWIWENDGSLGGRIDGRDIPASSGNMKSYQDIVKRIFEIARQDVKNSALQRIADALDVVRESNTTDEIVLD